MNVLETALLWHSLGIATIPVLAGSKKPALTEWGRWQRELPPESKLGIDKASQLWYTDLRKPGSLTGVFCCNANFTTTFTCCSQTGHGDSKNRPSELPGSGLLAFVTVACLRFRHKGAGKMIIKRIVPFGAEVSLTADECALLAKTCELSDIDDSTDHVNTLGAAFKPLAAAGYALFVAPPTDVDEVIQAVQEGRLQ